MSLNALRMFIVASPVATAASLAWAVTQTNALSSPTQHQLHRARPPRTEALEAGSGLIPGAPQLLLPTVTLGNLGSTSARARCERTRRLAHSGHATTGF